MLSTSPRSLRRWGERLQGRVHTFSVQRGAEVLCAGSGNRPLVNLE